MSCPCFPVYRSWPRAFLVRMASADVFLLSSSPLKQHHAFSITTMSSSPLPSPSDLYKGKSPLMRMESNAAAISTSAFAAALLETSKPGNLPDQDFLRLRNSHIADNESELIPKTKPATKPRVKKATASKIGRVKAPGKAAISKKDVLMDDIEEKKPRKPRAKKTEVAGEAEASKERAPRKPRSKKIKNESVGDEAVKEKIARKPRAKKAEGDTQTRISGQVTKAAAKSKDLSCKDLTSKHCSTIEPDSIDYGLVKAVKRKTGWSPPAVSSKGHITDLEFTSPEAIMPRFNGFNDLVGNFGFISGETLGGPTKAKSQGPGVTRKRKLIELVKTNVATAAAGTPKVKAPKKTARTITGLALSAFVEEGVDEASDPSAPLLQYFSYATTEQGVIDGLKKAKKPRSRSPVKSKKGTSQAPILLSPASAMKQVRRQDFVFGTSSQLAREDSPAYLRDLQQAMQASNAMVDDPFILPFDDTFKDMEEQPLAVVHRERSRISTKRSDLWSAAARDTTGSLFDVEMVDMIDTPTAARQQTPQKTSAPLSHDNDEWHDIEDDIGSLPQVTGPIITTPSKRGPIEAAIRLELLSSPTSSSPSKTKSPRRPKISQAQAAPTTKKPQATKKAKVLNNEMPDYSAYTTVQLEKQLKVYHFKPIKSRDSMIKLLEKCWEGQNRTALDDLSTNVKSHMKSPKKGPVSSQAAVSSPKKRGRPRKDSIEGILPSPAKAKKKVGRPKKSDTPEIEDSDVPLSQIHTPKKSPRKSPKKSKQQPIDEIDDSEPNQTPSPPRRRPSQILSPPRPLQLSSSSTISSLETLPPTSTQDLFTHITKAITSLPPTTDPSKPTWHEKILLYDPIILEDLTIWLNTGALGNVGWDGEVEPKIVKKWCEGRGVCCLWRENLRGGSRSRY